MLQLGVGTITFYEPETKEFAALGHGILDVDTTKAIAEKVSNVSITGKKKKHIKEENEK